jgi:hypothetical protein
MFLKKHQKDVGVSLKQFIYSNKDSELNESAIENDLKVRNIGTSRATESHSMSVSSGGVREEVYFALDNYVVQMTFESIDPDVQNRIIESFRFVD